MAYMNQEENIKFISFTECEHTHIYRALRSEMNRQKDEYFEKFRNVPLHTVLQDWLNNKGYHEDVITLIYNKIFPEFNPSGSIYTLGEFIQQNHDEIIDSIRTLETLSVADKEGSLLQCYSSFLNYLEVISEGKFHRRKRLIILHSFFPDTAHTVTDWFNQARNDFNGAQDLFLSHPTLHGLALYLLQQATETSLKSFCLFNGGDLKYSHDLNKLLAQCIEWDPTLVHFKNLVIKLNPYNTTPRYPKPNIDNINIIKEYTQVAGEIIKNVHSLLIHIQQKMSRPQKNTSFGNVHCSQSNQE
jgi:HEPN domain-containing protein